LERALSDTLPPGPLESDSVVSVALLPAERRPSIVVQYLYRQTIEESPRVAIELDQILAALAVSPRMEKP
jgi:hypothetical protein